MVFGRVWEMDEFNDEVKKALAENGSKWRGHTGDGGGLETKCWGTRLSATGNGEQ